MGYRAMLALALLGLAALGLVLWPALSVAAAEPSQPVGERFQVLIRDLPPPFATPSAANHSRRIPRLTAVQEILLR